MRSIPGEVIVNIVHHQLNLELSAGIKTPRVPMRGGHRFHKPSNTASTALLGPLRQNPLVRNVGRTNLADLTLDLIPDRIGLIAVDLSCRSVTDAIGQVERIEIAEDAGLVALVKPMFEVGLGALPCERRYQQVSLSVTASA